MSSSFSSSEPTTFAELVSLLDGCAASVFVGSEDYERISHLATHLAHLRTWFALSAPEGEVAEELGNVLARMEEVGVRGWVRYLDIVGRYEADCDLSCKEVEGLRGKFQEREKEVEELREAQGYQGAYEKGGAAGLQESGWESGKGMREKTEEKQEKKKSEEESIEDLRQRIGKLETQIGRLVQLRRTEEGLLIGTGLPELPSITEESDSDNSWPSRRKGRSQAERESSGLENRRPALDTGSSTIAEVGSPAERPEHRDDDAIFPSDSISMKAGKCPGMARRSFEEVARERWNNFFRGENWDPDEHDGYRAFVFHTPPRSPHTPSTSSQSNNTAPVFEASSNYITFLLPPGFTIPNQAPHFFTLTFRSPCSVFHFHAGTNRDQLLSLLHERRAEGKTVPGLAPGEDVNIMKVRTHELEWELKNALRRAVGGKEWDRVVGGRWEYEGEGDTYIVSRTDVSLGGNGSGSEEGSGSDETLGEIGSATACLRGGAGIEEQRKNEGGKNVSTEGREEERRLWESLRPYIPLAGDTPYQTPVITSSGRPYTSPWPRRLSSPTHTTPTLRQSSQTDSTWHEYAHILQLQNGSLIRFIEGLQEMLHDAEQYMAWQETQLDGMSRALGDWQKELNEAKAEARVAREAADATKEEAKQWKAVSRGLYKEDLEREEEATADEEDPLSWEGPRLPKLRGGAPHNRFDIEPHSSTDPAEREAAEASEVDTSVEATSFYFFPSVSIAVLHASPLRYFQWPRGTTLPQIHQMLDSQHANGTQDNPYLSRICDILERREEMGAPLPDMSDGRVVFIGIPPLEEEKEEESESQTWWESGSGPDEWEREHFGVLRHRRFPVAVDRSHLSPPQELDSNDEEKYADVGDVIRTLSGDIDDDYYASDGSECSVRHEDEAPALPSPLVSGNEHAPLSDTVIKDHSRWRTRSPPQWPIAPCKPYPPKLPPTHPIWNMVRPPTPGGSELDRSANFDYELANSCLSKDVDQDIEDLGSSLPESGCVLLSGAPCTFCDMRVAEEAREKNDNCAIEDSDFDEVLYMASTPRTDRRRSSLKKSGSDSQEEETASPKTKKSEQTPCSSASNSLELNLRGGAAGLPSCSHTRFSPSFTSSSSRPKTPYPCSRIPDLSTTANAEEDPYRNWYKAWLSDPQFEDPPRISHGRMKNNFNGIEAPRETNAKEKLAGVLAPPNSPLTRQRPFATLPYNTLSTLNPLFDTYEKRADWGFPKQKDADDKDVQDRLAAMRKEIRELQAQLASIEATKRAIIDLRSGGGTSAKAPKSCTHTHKGNAGRRAVRERFAGPWIPPTVAGPSKSRMIRRKEGKEEYDGMILGKYENVIW